MLLLLRTKVQQLVVEEKSIGATAVAVLSSKVLPVPALRSIVGP